MIRVIENDKRKIRKADAGAAEQAALEHAVPQVALPANGADSNATVGPAFKALCSFQDVDCAATYACVVRTSGLVLCWGAGAISPHGFASLSPASGVPRLGYVIGMYPVCSWAIHPYRQRHCRRSKDSYRD